MTKLEAFIKECLANGKLVMRGHSPNTRVWLDDEAHRYASALAGRRCVSRLPRPIGSIPIKEAIQQVAEATGLGTHTLTKHWRTFYKIPFVELRRTRTRVDIDPACIPVCIEHMRRRGYRPAETPKPQALTVEAKVGKDGRVSAFAMWQATIASRPKNGTALIDRLLADKASRSAVPLSPIKAQAATQGRADSGAAMSIPAGGSGGGLGVGGE